ncbi:MAG: hypothetical protein RJB26_1458 [Pseudomonadota bacterium]|jgi:hypothetical protein
MRRPFALLNTLLVSALLFAAPVANAWKLAEASTPPVTSTKGDFQLTVPKDWKYDTGGGDILMSWMGTRLGTIQADFRKHRKAFAALKKDSRPDATPEELAEDYLADFRKLAGNSDVEQVSNEPAELGGQPAFRMVLAYRNAVDRGAVRYRQVVIGTVNAKGLVVLTYSAPVLHWFDTQLPAFEAVASSFKFGLPPPEKKR